jgi:two-component system nitrate/nitrite response regulator NarL
MLEGSQFDVIVAGPSIASVAPLGGSEAPALAVLVLHNDEEPMWHREALALFPGIRVAVLADSLTRPQIDRMSASGVDGFLHHAISRDNLLRALHLVLDGMCVLPSLPSECDLALDSDSEWLDGRENADGEQSPANVECLSNRELRVLEGLAEGASNKVIARRLGITDSTVKVHVKSIFRKTKMNNRVQLALWASNRGGPFPLHRAAVVEYPEFRSKLASRAMRDGCAGTVDLALTA